MEGTHNNSWKHDYPIRKDSGSARYIQKIRQLFLTGQPFTARELNVLAGFNDARKVISILRNKEGWPIGDCRLHDGRKVYRLEKGGKR